jgi:15-cis-phytoene desaturase
LNPDVLVVGGGVAGLQCGAALADAGLRVLLLEASSCLGGRAASWTDHTSGDTVDIGPHVLASDYRHFLALLQRLRTDHLVLWQRQPLITLLDGGRQLRMRSSSLPPPLHALPNLPQALRSVPLAQMASNWRVAWQALRAAEADTLALDGVSALQWLNDRGVHPRFIDWFWASACRALLNLPLNECSAAALQRVFRLMITRSGYCFGFPRAGLAQLYAPGCQALIESAGGVVRLNAEVSRLEVEDGRAKGVRLSDGSQVQAAAVVLALPPAALAALAPPRWTQPAGWEALFKPSPYVCTYLWFDRKLTAERFWARVWSPDDLNMDFYDLSNIRPTPVGAPSLIAANCIHAVHAQHLDDAQIVRRTVAEIAEFAPEAAQARVRRADIHRVPMAIACPRPGTEAARPPAATPFANVWLAGDWTATGLPSSMESAARSGALAAEAVGASLGRQVKVVQPVPPPQGLGAVLSRAARQGPTQPGRG